MKRDIVSVRWALDNIFRDKKIVREMEESIKKGSFSLCSSSGKISSDEKDEEKGDNNEN